MTSAASIQLTDALRSIVGPEHVRTDDESRITYGTDALKRGRPADIVVLPGSTTEVAAVVRACAAERVAIVPRGAGTGYTGGSVPTQGGVVLSLERMNRILEIDEANLIAVVEPQRHHRRSAGRRRARRPVLSAGSGVAPAVLHRRECRRVRRWAARVQVRHDQAVRARPGSRAPDRRDHRNGREGRQERRRLRPHAPARGLGRHARHHHEDHPPPDPEAAVPRHAAGNVRERRARRVWRQRNHPPARGAGRDRAHRRHVARGCRTEPAGSLARTGRHGGDSPDRARRRARGGRRRNDARRARAPGRERHRDPASPPTRRSGTSCGASGGSSRCR